MNTEKEKTPVVIEYEKEKYQYKNGSWFNIKTFEVPPLAILKRLNNERHKTIDQDALSYDEILNEAQRAREEHMYNKAAGFCSKAILKEPDQLGARVIMASIQRQQNRPDEAIKTLGAIKNSGLASAHTVKAAAFCDLGRWDEALKACKQALATAGQADKKVVFAVYNRIKKERPELFK